MWSAIMLSACSLPASGQSSNRLLEGELPIELSGRIVGANQFPSVREIAARVDRPQPETIAVIKVFGDSNNHYAPVWSPSGRLIAYLRSDLDKGTRKVITQTLGQPPQTIYGDRTSFEDQATWSTGLQSTLIFDSTNEPSGNQNIHQFEEGMPARIISSGSGVIEFPAMHTGPAGKTLLFRRDRELFISNLLSDSDATVDTRSIGEGEEAQPSPNGKLLAVVGRSEKGQQYRLILRELSGFRQKVLHMADGSIIRNPRFSPDGKKIAFHSRPINDQHWGLWIIDINRTAAARRIADDIRVQEDFRHVGPAWNTSSNGIWVFAGQSSQAHYRLRFARTENGELIDVSYPREITSSSEAACSPHPDYPILLFAGHTRKSRDIFALVLSYLP